MRKVLFIFGELTDGDVDWLSKAGERVHGDPGTLLVPLASRFYRALCVFLADRMRAATQRLGYGDVLPDEQGELNENVLDSVHLAGARFDRMLKKLAG